MSTNRLFFARAVLVAAKMERGPQYEQVLVAVMTGEDSTAWWNPMDTTLAIGDHTPYNSFGPGGEWHVWNYADASLGVYATVATLEQENMAPFTSLMRKPGHTALDLARAFSRTPWGGLGDLLPYEIVRDYDTQQRSYVADRRNHVSGPGPWPYRSSGEPMG